MRVTKNLRPDQELILRFLDVFGGGAAILSSSKHARPGFFLFAHTFIHEYIEESFFKKEELLLQALEDEGFPGDEGPIGSMHAEQKKSCEAAELLLNAAKAWQAGEQEARVDVGWAASEYSSTLRKNMDRLKNLIFPLLEQNLTSEDEHKIAEGFNNILFEGMIKNEQPEKFIKLIQTLEDELSEWK
jgi:hemerythrin-like domain-containing protein